MYYVHIILVWIGLYYLIQGQNCNLIFTIFTHYHNQILNLFIFICTILSIIPNPHISNKYNTTNTPKNGKQTNKKHKNPKFLQKTNKKITHTTLMKQTKNTKNDKQKAKDPLYSYI